MSNDVKTGIYPVGDAHTGRKTCSHGWFMVEIDAADGETVPPVLALPVPLESGDYELVIEVQCSQITLKQGSVILATIDCTGRETDVLTILQGGRIGLTTVPVDFMPGPETHLPVDHMAIVDMQPFHDDHQHRLAVMKEHDPALYEQQYRLFDAMPAYRRARKLAESRPAPVEVSADRKAAIWASVMDRKDTD